MKSWLSRLSARMAGSGMSHRQPQVFAPLHRRSPDAWLHGSWWFTSVATTFLVRRRHSSAQMLAVAHLALMQYYNRIPASQLSARTSPVSPVPVCPSGFRYGSSKPCGRSTFDAKLVNLSFSRQLAKALVFPARHLAAGRLHDRAVPTKISPPSLGAGQPQKSHISGDGFWPSRDSLMFAARDGAHG